MSVLDQTARKLEADEKAAERLGKPFAGFAGEQKPLPAKLPPVPEFNIELAPASLRDWIKDNADGLQVPAEFVAVPAICALGGLIGRQVGIRIKQRDQTWIELPILNAGLIGRPSTGKSPSFRPTIKILNNLETRQREAWLEEMKEHRVELELQQAEIQSAKKKAQASLKSGDREGARQALEVSGEEVEKPPQPRIVVNDVTIEKLGEILNENPRGLIQFRDELAGWLASLDREGRQEDRNFWLETWNGHGPYTCDRIGRGSIRIEAPAVSIIGGIQPGKLESYVRAAVRGGFGDDGLIQRLQMTVFPDVPANWRYVDREPDPNAAQQAFKTFERLEHIDPDAIGAEGEDPRFLRFDPDAQELFIEWYSKLMNRLRQGEEAQHMESHLAKYPALAARLALVLHLADNDQGPVSGESLARALDWCEFLEPHARRVYAPVTDNGLSAAHEILNRKEQIESAFTARQIYQRGWSGLDRAETVQAGIEVLIEYGWLAEDEEETGGRPTIKFWWTDGPKPKIQSSDEKDYLRGAV